MIWLVGSEFCLFLVGLGAALEQARVQRELRRPLPPVLAEAGRKIEVSGVANRVTT